MDQADFSTLAGEMFGLDGTVNLEAADRLWTAAFRLPAWYVLMTPKSFIEQAPSAQMIGGKIWFLAFTDTAALRSYAEKNQNLDEQGNALYLTLAPEQVVEMARTMEASNVFGFRFNEAQQHGWYIPLGDLKRIPAYLKEKGLL